MQNRLLFVAKDMQLARIRCAIWNAAGYQTYAATFHEALAWSGQSPDLLVISYHFAHPPDRSALAARFPTARVVLLERGLVGAALVRAVQ